MEETLKKRLMVAALTGLFAGLEGCGAEATPPAAAPAAEHGAGAKHGCSTKNGCGGMGASKPAEEQQADEKPPGDKPADDHDQHKH